MLLVLMCCGHAITAQKYYSKTGKITFHSDAALEKIEATNTSASTVMDITTGAIEWGVLVQGFQFEKALMKDHFNENYMESSIYPKAKFKGKFETLAGVNFTKDGTYNIKVSGQLEMHGVSKPMTVPATITVKNGMISAKASISISLSDFKIEIPKVVEDNVATEVILDVSAEYKLMPSTT
jgi:polyisoprenoid-binding protein YceI